MSDLKGKTILVTGATGFLGSALVVRLAANGAEVRALARRPGRDRYIKDIANVQIFSGDITNIEQMREVTQGCDYVFHAAAALGGNLAYQRKINVEGTSNIMRAAGEAGAQRIVHVSSIAVYGYGYRTDVTEDTLLNPGSVPYNISKAEAESAAREIASEHNLSYSILRPGMIYGPRGGMWTATMFKIAQRKPTIFIGDGSGHSHPIYIDDVVDLALLLAVHPRADGQVFNCAPDPAPTWREFLGAYSRLAGHDRWWGLPVGLAKIIAPIAEFIFTLRGEPQDVPNGLTFLQAPTTYKMTKARDLLGWQPYVDLHTGIQNCAPWLREKGWLT
jgi:2-alkyl-3-oxoalkanoate reductase